VVRHPWDVKRWLWFRLSHGVFICRFSFWLWFSDSWRRFLRFITRRWLLGGRLGEPFPNKFAVSAVIDGRVEDLAASMKIYQLEHS
jgi:hypothetical protein